MLDKILKHQKYIIWIVAFAFIVGMAIMGVSGIFSKKSDTVGIIDGKKISYAYFMNELQKNVENYRQQNPNAEINTDLMSQLSDQTWQRLVQQIVLDKQIKKFHIKVTDDDILREMQNNPPQELMQNPSLQTNGRFDRKKYLSALKQDTQFFNALENYYREKVPYDRLIERVKAKANITLDSLKAEYIKDNDEMFGKIIFFDYNKMPKPDVTDAEIKAYYEKNKDTDKEIKKGKFAIMKFLIFEVKPSDADYNLAKQDIDDIYADLIKGADFGQMAKDYSDDPGSAAQNGSLGTISKGQMVPEFEQVAFSLGAGQISKPFKTSYGWHIVRVDSVGSVDGQPQIKVSHILKKVTASVETKDALMQQAENARALIKKVGIDKAAKQLKMEAIDTDAIYEDSDYIPGIGQHDALLKFLRKKGVGAVSNVEKDRRGNYIVAQITQKSKDPYVPFDKAKMRIKYELEKQKKIAAIKPHAQEFVKRYQPNEYLTAAASDTLLRVIPVQNFKMDTSIAGVGTVKEVNAVALKLNTGQISSLLDTKDGQFIVICEKRVKPDINAFLKDKDAQKKYKDRMEEQAWNRWYDNLMKSVKIVDNRQDFNF
ncbi:MAG: peptidylprolyl isomerase [Candidatus Cloacimonadaceae bacterium]